MTPDDDIEINERIQAASKALTEALNHAYSKGLVADIDIVEHNVIGRRRPLTYITVGLLRPVPTK